MVLASAAGFATLPILIKVAYSAGTNTMTILATRFVLASLCLWLILHHQGLSARVTRRDAASLCLLGIVGYGAMSTSFAASLHYLPASLCSMLLYTYPAIVALLSFSFKLEEFNWQKGLALSVCFIGLFLILGVSFSGIHWLGIVLGLSSSLLYSAYILAGNFLLKNVNPLVATTYVCTSAAITFMIAAVVSGDYLPLSPTGWGILLAMALLSTIVGILGCFAGISRIGAVNTSIISTAEPVMTVLMSILLLGENITPAQLCGGGLILAGILILQLWAEKQTAAAAN
ncbi:MAG TPA: DMT family transporter [Patescibacteria group bacterium]|nr:DMT family transporter [Patescibacteria group bacterium]